MMQVKVFVPAEGEVERLEQEYRRARERYRQTVVRGDAGEVELAWGEFAAAVQELDKAVRAVHSL